MRFGIVVLALDNNRIELIKSAKLFVRSMACTSSQRVLFFSQREKNSVRSESSFSLSQSLPSVAMATMRAMRLLCLANSLRASCRGLLFMHASSIASSTYSSERRSSVNAVGSFTMNSTCFSSLTTRFFGKSH